VDQHFKREGINTKSAVKDPGHIGVGPLPLTDEQKKALGDQSAGKKLEGIILQDLLKEKGLTR
jgi:hypothetical protein